MFNFVYQFFQSDDEIEEDVSIRIPTPIEPPPDDEPEEPPTEEGQEAWTQPKAPVSSPASLMDKTGYQPRVKWYQTSVTGSLIYMTIFLL